MIILSILFFITAILYSSVGFGGGSTYLALLLIWDIPYYIFPLIALFCNVIVVSGNSFNYIRAGNFNFRLLLPFLFGSIPFAFIGGSLVIQKEIFEILLFCVLSIAGILLLINNKSFDDKNIIIKKLNFFLAFAIGAILGFVSGVVGIGGGIFFKSYSFIIKSRKSKSYCYNSLIIHTYKFCFRNFRSTYKKNSILNEIINYWPLFLWVLIGGFLGNYINIKILSGRMLALITSILVIFVAMRMGYRIFL